MSNTVKLQGAGFDTIELPVLQGTLGNDVIDIRALKQSTNMFTLDPGFVSTASCESKITFIDGDKGLLYYRGYPIEQLAEHSDYLEVCYLLIYGELPTKEQKKAFVNTVTRHTMVHEQLTWFFRGFRRDAHPMAMMVGVVGALSAFYQDSLEIADPEHRKVAIYRLISKIPTIAAMCYRYSNGLPFNFPRNDLSYTANFMHMMFATPCEAYEPNPVLVRALDRIFILHADHEQNASTTTVRTVGSTHAHPYACIAAGIGALWGWAHGGANEGVIRQLEQIGSVENVDKYIARAKDKNDPFRLMGFGHRVYKNFDPRAKVLKSMCDKLFDEIGINTELLKIAKKIEEIALNDEYFISRNLYPNVDFYSGLILKALSIPNDMFAVIFVIGRIPGWISQWIELKEQESIKIVRPRQLYVGETNRTPK